MQIGKSAETYSNNSEAIVINGFDTPRSIISDFEAAEKTLQAFIKQIEPKKSWWNFLPFVPVIVIHPLEKIQDGLTMVEARALEDLCWRARAAEVYVWTGQVLTDAELRDLRFPSEGKLHNKSGRA